MLYLHIDMLYLQPTLIFIRLKVVKLDTSYLYCTYICNAKFSIRGIRTRIAFRFFYAQKLFLKYGGVIYELGKD